MLGKSSFSGVFLGEKSAFGAWGLLSVSEDFITKYCKLGGISRNLDFCSSGDKAKSRCWPDPAPLRASWALLASSSSGWPQALLGSGCITPGSTSIFTRPSSTSLCLFSSKDPSLQIRGHPNLVQLILTWLHLQRPYFQRMCHLQLLGVGLEHTFWGTQFNPQEHFSSICPLLNTLRVRGTFCRISSGLWRQPGISPLVWQMSLERVSKMEMSSNRWISEKQRLEEEEKVQGKGGVLGSLSCFYFMPAGLL